ncbi:MAG: glycosyl transferase group 1 [candidate division WWE3 bacterium GW2011_GWC1_41_7]|uniref:Glycosyl transferase group 1 n=3 Tax=Katanobacteria TaxID=422282 RepID=A0A0G0X932_UNCKA|nr:MAG: putative glycosyltransferase, type 1 [candidate division WWE3 bacterium GW2011_GWB1_41_6]KKS21460.1 MAG: glycosyl transferase group 1 [candidate division WWE3 bacterium GW2011_GWC1_41_7]OGC57958.1 MAG: hypothetical protein A2976_02045 [candidate division WWE3 bacterium RIFCSPLOWO2_01_FULL_41_9]
MKILRIVYDWPPPWHGLAPHPYEITSAQTQLGHSFVLFCGHWPKAGQRERLPNTDIYPFVREPLPGTLPLTTSLLMFFYYLYWRAEEGNKVDLIHSHGHFGIWIYFYRFLLQKIYRRAAELKTPLVVHFHNVAAMREKAAEEKNIDVKTHSKYLSWPFEKFANRMAVHTASACIFVSEENMKDAIDLYGADPAKCFVVESGVNTDIFRPVGAEEREKSKYELDLDRQDIVIVNHGVMLERKNVHLLIESLKYLPDVYKLLLIGPGDNEYLLRLDKMIKDMHLEERVVRGGYTPYPQTPIAFQVSDIFVLPSSWEGFPKVVMQSLACGIPALVSGFRAKNDIQGLYYLDDPQPETIAQRIREIVENPVQVDRYEIERFYSWKVKVKEIETIYSKIIPH